MEEGTRGGHMDPLGRGNRMYFIHRLGAVLQFGMRMRGTDGRKGNIGTKNGIQRKTARTEGHLNNGMETKSCGKSPKIERAPLKRFAHDRGDEVPAGYLLSFSNGIGLHSIDLLPCQWFPMEIHPWKPDNVFALYKLTVKTHHQG